MYIYKSLNVKHPVFILMNHYLERNFLLILHSYKVYNYLECSQAKKETNRKKSVYYSLAKNTIITYVLPIYINSSIHSYIILFEN